MKNKKSSLFFLPLLVLISIIVLTELFFVLWNKNSAFQMPLGKRETDLYGAYLTGEEALLYIDQSSKYALQQSVYDLAKNGGISEDKSSKECGSFYGSSLWYVLEKNQNVEAFQKKCFDADKVNDSLIHIFNTSLNKYLDKYPSNIRSNYTYQLKDGIDITGKAVKPLKFEIKKE